MIAQVDRLELT